MDELLDRLMEFAKEFEDAGYLDEAIAVKSVVILSKLHVLEPVNISLIELVVKLINKVDPEIVNEALKEAEKEIKKNAIKQALKEHINKNYKN